MTTEREAVPASPDLVGQELGGTYRVLRRMAEGGMGAIYEAQHLRLPKRFVIKVMLPAVAADQVLFERFRREAEASSSLGNPHIVKVIDFNFLPDRSPYMVMEHLEGEDLMSRVGGGKKLAPAQVVRILREVADGLMSAHSAGIIHRDLKPSNIFLARTEGGDEVAKVLDFGAAKVSGPGGKGNITAVGQTIGTPWYMSPEQAKGRPLDARSDQFGLAVVVYEALTGRLPFEAEEPLQVLFMITREPPRPIRSWEPSLPAELEAVLGKALAKEAAQRFESVKAFADAVVLALGDGVGDPSLTASATVQEVPVVIPPEPVRTPVSVPEATVEEAPRSRTAEARPARKFPWVALGATVGGLVALGAVVLWPDSAPAPRAHETSGPPPEAVVKAPLEPVSPVAPLEAPTPASPPPTHHSSPPPTHAAAPSRNEAIHSPVAKGARSSGRVQAENKEIAIP